MLAIALVFDVVASILGGGVVLIYNKYLFTVQRIYTNVSLYLQLNKNIIHWALVFVYTKQHLSVEKALQLESLYSGWAYAHNSICI